MFTEKEKGMHYISENCSYLKDQFFVDNPQKEED